jgi:cytoplasmic FMR1 interacting protein
MHTCVCVCIWLLVILFILYFCVCSIETERYLLPDDLHMFYRVIPNCIFLMDSDDRTGLNCFKVKAINLPKLQKLYKEFPFIPIYADTTMQVDRVLARCRNWEPEMVSKWRSNVPAKLEKRYLLIHKYKAFRQTYNRLAGEVTALLGDIRTSQTEEKVVTPETLLRSYTLVLECVQNISRWSAAIREQCSYKYSNACHETAINKKSKDQKVSYYERVVRFNYTNPEMYALLDVIGLMKGLGSLLISNKLLYLPLCLRYIHDDVQIFVQQEVARPLRKAHKRNRAIKDVMLQMRSICGDWVNYEQAKDDYKQKKKELVNIQREFPRRSVTPTVTQLTLLNRMVFHIFSSRAPGMQGGMFADKDLKKEWIAVWEQFYKNSNYYQFFFNFQQNVEAVMDIGFLWFREHFLEMAVGEVQFPLRMSLPWLLVDYVINTATMKENIFFPMDIYNDAATTSLNHLRQQFLYDEVEAETALSFNQLVFSLGDDCFKYHKSVASSILVQKNFQRSFSELKRQGQTIVSTSRFAALMQQRHINLLGRPVDLHDVLSASLNTTLRKNIRIIIAKLESRVRRHIYICV